MDDVIIIIKSLDDSGLLTKCIMKQLKMIQNSNYVGVFVSY